MGYLKLGDVQKWVAFAPTPFCSEEDGIPLHRPASDDPKPAEDDSFDVRAMAEASWDQADREHSEVLLWFEEKPEAGEFLLSASIAEETNQE